MSFIDLLDDAMYSGRKLTVRTQERGEIVGIPYCVDEFDSDPERLGYCLFTGEHEQDTVFLDEIVDVVVIPKADEFKRAAV
ncbi:MAG: hypothetical protein FWD34_05725 [Oscillospiraceae bacterium]|nr:hypothetical protein [Oscillospiraceae bacterium]